MLTPADQTFANYAASVLRRGREPYLIYVALVRHVNRPERHVCVSTDEGRLPCLLL